MTVSTIPTARQDS